MFRLLTLQAEAGYQANKHAAYVIYDDQDNGGETDEDDITDMNTNGNTTK